MSILAKPHNVRERLTESKCDICLTTCFETASKSFASFSPNFVAAQMIFDNSLGASTTYGTERVTRVER